MLMTPQEFLDSVKTKSEQLIHTDLAKIEKDTNQIARIIQSKVLGFKIDTRHGNVTHVSDEFIDDIMKSSKKEIEILKTKVKNSVTNKLKRIAEMDIPEAITYRFEHEITKMIEAEQNKIKPVIQKIVKKQVEEQMLKPWILTAKMQGIDTDEIMGINKGSNTNKDDDLPF